MTLNKSLNHQTSYNILEMAEVAGLVIGGISLATIFDQCITILKYVDSGRHCSDEYKTAAMELAMLGGRLNRWERTVEASTDLQTTAEDGETAQEWLKHIRNRLEDAEKLGKRYEVDDKPESLTDTSIMVVKLQRKVLRRRDETSLTTRMRWALIDQEKMRELTTTLDRLVGNLEQILSSLQAQRLEMLRNDIAGLLVSRPEVSPQAFQSLENAAARVDKDFEKVVRETRHSYRNIENVDKAMVNVGDYYSSDWSSTGSANTSAKHDYDGIRSSGQSIVNIGNMYGKSIFEMRQS